MKINCFFFVVYCFVFFAKNKILVFFHFLLCVISLSLNDFVVNVISCSSSYLNNEDKLKFKFKYSLASNLDAIVLLSEKKIKQVFIKNKEHSRISWSRLEDCLYKYIKILFSFKKSFDSNLRLKILIDHFLPVKFKFGAFNFILDIKF